LRNGLKFKSLFVFSSALSLFLTPSHDFCHAENTVRKTEFAESLGIWQKQAQKHKGFALQPFKILLNLKKFLFIQQRGYAMTYRSSAGSLYKFTGQSSPNLNFRMHECKLLRMSLRFQSTALTSK